MAQMPYDEQRVARERDFHNERFRDHGSRSSQGKFYWAVSDGASDFRRAYQELARGKDVLEYGCGDTRNFMTLAPTVNTLQAIDISNTAIERLKSENTHDNVELHVMDATNMTFADNSFDLIFGSGIIHHLDTEISAREVARVLRPGGSAVFWEPLGQNPLINMYRYFTPDARTPDEHPLVAKDFAIMAEHFDALDLRYYGLSTLAAVPVRNTKIGPRSFTATRKIDNAMFKLPGMKRLAWFALVIGTKW